MPHNVAVISETIPWLCRHKSCSVPVNIALVWLFTSAFIHLMFFQLLQHQRGQVKQGACQAAPNLSLLKHQHQFLLSKKGPPHQEAFWILILVSLEILLLLQLNKCQWCQCRWSDLCVWCSYSFITAAVPSCVLNQSSCWLFSLIKGSS